MKKAILSGLFVLAITSVAHAAPVVPIVDNSNQPDAKVTSTVHSDKPLFPQKGSKGEMSPTDVFIVVNQKPIFFERLEDRPFIDQQGRTQVPVRFVSEALGKKVDWEGSTQTVTIAGQIKVRIKSSVVQVGESRTIHMDTIARLKDDRTFVPVRFVSEALGQKVDWDENARTVVITTPEGGE